MGLQLYYINSSPPARAVLLTIRNLGIDVEIKSVDLRRNEHLTPEFIKLNPRHTIPIIVDGDFVLSESRAIMAYLVNSRKPGSDLYPTDAKKRALVDERLYFDGTAVFPWNCAAVVSLKYCRSIQLLISWLVVKAPVYLEGATDVPQNVKDKIAENMTLLDELIENKSWFAGDNVTIADLTILADVTQIQVTSRIKLFKLKSRPWTYLFIFQACGYDISKHVNLSKWLERCKNLPGFKENQSGADLIGEFFRGKAPNAFN